MVDSFGRSWPQVAWAVLGLLVVTGVALVLYSFVGALVVGLFLYYALRPVYRWLDDRLDHPNVTATATLLVVGLPLLAVLAYAGLVGVNEADAVLRRLDLQRYRVALRPYTELTSLTDPRALLQPLGTLVPRLLSVGSAVLLWALRLFVIVTVAFYLLRDDHEIAGWVRDTFDSRYGVVAFFERVDADLTTIYTGNLITIGVTGALAVAVYYGLAVVAPASTEVVFPVLLGLLTGVATLIPALGMKLVYFPYTLYLFAFALQTDRSALWFPVVFFLVTLVVVDAVPDVIIRAEISKGEYNLGLMLLTYTLGAVVFGWYGVFLGPILLVVFLHFVRDVFPNLIDTRTDRIVSRED